MAVSRANNRQISSTWRVIFLLFFVIVTFLGCSGGGGGGAGTTAPPTLEKVTLTPQSLHLAFGKTRAFKFVGTYTDQSTKDLTSLATWTSSAPAVASVGTQTGIVTASTTSAQTVITAIYESHQATTALTIVAVALEKLTITSANSFLVVGGKNQFTATGEFSNGTTGNITASSTWRISSSAATIGTTTGLATGVSVGSVIVTALLNGIEGATTTSVRAVELLSITVTPSRPFLLKGLFQQFTATGHFSDDTSRVLISGEVVWSSSGTSTVTIDQSGKAKAVGVGKVDIKATAIPSLKSKVGTSTLIVAPGNISSIELIPEQSSIAKQTTLQFIALGTFDNGAVEDITEFVAWTASSSSVATIDAVGLATAANVVTTSTTTVTATFGAIGTSSAMSATTSLTVRNAALTQISVTPVFASVPVGVTESFFATGIFDEVGTTTPFTQDLSRSVTWSTSSSTATIGERDGIAKGQIVGTSSIQATADFGPLPRVVGSTQLTITNATLSAIKVSPEERVIAVDSGLQFKAVGSFSDGATKDLTNVAEWSVSAGGDFASITSFGLATGLKEGIATIKTSFRSKNATTTLEVKTIVLKSIRVEAESSNSIPVGISRQYKALGLYGDFIQDITDQVTWSSSAPSIAKVNKGLATAENSGNTEIYAKMATLQGEVVGEVVGTGTLVVNDAQLARIDVTPSAKSVGVGIKLQYTATAVYTTPDDSFDVTDFSLWSVSDGSKAVISSSGFVTTIATADPPPATISVIAQFQNRSGTTSLTITNATLNAIVISPANPSIALGATAQFTAEGVFPDGNRQDMTDVVHWESDDEFKAVVSNIEGSQGLATGLTVSSPTIKAVYGFLVGTTTLTINSAVPVHLPLGKNHTCARMTDGEMKCWGQNSSGQLGNKTKDDATTPSSVEGKRGAVDMALGGKHTCAVFENGTISCWGDNTHGQIGDGTNISSTVPRRVSDLLGAQVVTAGQSHTCAILQSGVLKCWGDNQFGQLGNGGTSSSTVPVATDSSVFLSKEIDAGDLHTCALLSNGSVGCWGGNASGQLGDNNATTSATPRITSIVATAVSAGGAHTCAIVTGGSVVCWGENGSGQLGDNSTTTSSAPVSVQLPVGTAAKAISAGGAHTCAVLSNDAVACWGDNRFGQLGNNSTTHSLTPVILGISAEFVSAGGFHTCAKATNGVANCWGSNNFGQIGNNVQQISRTPILVPEITSATSTSLGGNFTCSNNAGGVIKCMGDNESGQLGNGQTERTAVPTDVQDPTIFTAATAGGSHACARTSLGGVKCWGANNSGQLGNGDPGGQSKTTPVSVFGGLTATALSAGDAHTCAIAGGGVKCWGFNLSGQLGNDSENGSTVPSSVLGISTATALSAGESHTCAILQGGDVQCWGQNGAFQLGNDNIDIMARGYSSVPVSGGPSNAIAIAMGGLHSCAILMDNTVHCWGDNTSGQMGIDDPTVDATSTPTSILGFSAKAITAGQAHTCAILFSSDNAVNNTVRCWGGNNKGQLGNGVVETGNQFAPVFVPESSENLLTPLTAVSIDAGREHTCAVLADGKMKCWGSNASGQIGSGLILIEKLPTPVGL
ncbi:MAG: Ig-like domain-containing protein [Nitrospirota bacterium]